MAWLRTREGRITAGGGFLPSAIQPSGDGTLQGALDQVGGGGGTLSEWINATRDLTGGVGDLTDLLQAQNPLPPTSTPLTAPGNLRYVGQDSPTHQRIAWDPVPGAADYEIRGVTGTSTDASGGPPWPESGTSHAAYIGTGGKFTYQVRARDAEGNYGPWSLINFG